MLFRLAGNFVHVELVVVFADTVGDDVEPLADMLTGEPWVRCPPELRSRPMKVVAPLQEREEHGLVHLRTEFG